jgi:hypothetical protein
MSNVGAEVLLMKMSDRGRLCGQQKHAQRQDDSAPKNANIALALLKHWFQQPHDPIVIKLQMQAI